MDSQSQVDQGLSAAFIIGTHPVNALEAGRLRIVYCSERSFIVPPRTIAACPTALSMDATLAGSCKPIPSAGCGSGTMSGTDTYTAAADIVRQAPEAL